MILKVKNGIVYDEDGRIIGAITDGIEDNVEEVIECGSEAIPLIQDFIAQVNSGKLKPRAAVKKFEDLLNKHNLNATA